MWAATLILERTTAAAHHMDLHLKGEIILTAGIIGIVKTVGVIRTVGIIKTTGIVRIAGEIKIAGNEIMRVITARKSGMV